MPSATRFSLAARRDDAKRARRRAGLCALALIGGVVLAPVRALAASLPSAIAPTNGSARAVLLQVSSTTVHVGDRVSATVRVKGATTRRVVMVQRQEPGHWRTVAHSLTSARGRSTLELRWSSAGTYRIRVKVRATASAPLELSRSIVLRVLSVPPVYAGSALAPGATGARVRALQQRLSALGYWLGAPDGYFGDATEQAVFALQKSAGLPKSGIVDAATVQALENGVMPSVRSTTGTLIEVNLEKDLVLFVDNGKLTYTLNTSTGGGYRYVQDGVTNVADTPRGVFRIYRIVDGMVTDTLGQLWRPRFFYEGFALHGDSYVPATPVSHGCVRVSNEAIDWIWNSNLAPAGTEVWVY